MKLPRKITEFIKEWQIRGRLGYPIGQGFRLDCKMRGCYIITRGDFKTEISTEILCDGKEVIYASLALENAFESGVSITETQEAIDTLVENYKKRKVKFSIE